MRKTRTADVQLDCHDEDSHCFYTQATSDTDRKKSISELGTDEEETYENNSISELGTDEEETYENNSISELGTDEEETYEKNSISDMRTDEEDSLEHRSSISDMGTDEEETYEEEGRRVCGGSASAMKQVRPPSCDIEHDWGRVSVESDRRVGSSSTDITPPRLKRASDFSHIQTSSFLDRTLKSRHRSLENLSALDFSPSEPVSHAGLGPAPQNSLQVPGSVNGLSCSVPSTSVPCLCRRHSSTDSGTAVVMPVPDLNSPLSPPLLGNSDSDIENANSVLSSLPDYCSPFSRGSESTGSSKEPDYADLVSLSETKLS